MQFRQSGQRDYRRRRVLNENRLGRRAWRSEESDDSDSYANEALLARRSANYGDAEFLDEQCRLTDLVPMRLSTYLLMLLVAGGMIAGLEGLFLWMPRLTPFAGGRVAAFDLSGEGSLAAWFSSMILALAAATAILVFTVRRHRRDDYHGRYRVWIWAAMVFLLMSIDKTAGLREGFKEMMTWLTGNRIYGDGSIWWVVGYFFLLGGIGTRLLADMRECLASVAAFLAAAACYVAAVAATLEWIAADAGQGGLMLQAGAEMLGNVLLLLAVLLHARHVILDAEGLLPRRETESGDDDEDEQEIEDGRWSAVDEGEIMVHPPHGARRPRRPAKPAASRHPDPVVSQLTSPVSRKLTKQEKKALRMRLEKARRERGEE